MTDPTSLAIIAAAFMIGGAVKGLAGLGLPVITVAVLTSVFGLQTAMALMVMPGLIANSWQALTGGYMIPAFRRIASFLVPSLVTIWFGTGLLVALDSDWLVIILGVILAIYALTGVLGVTMRVPSSREYWFGPVFGAINGVTTGMSGVASTPSVIYLNGLGMPREMFIQAFGLLFLMSYVVLTASLWFRGIVGFEVGAISFVATAPTLFGMWIGRQLRFRTSESVFRRCFFWILLAIAFLIVSQVTLF